MAMVGLREVLVFSENEGKTITVSAGGVNVSGKVLRVNPLVLQPTDGSGVLVLDFDAIQSVQVQDATAEEVVNACKPQQEARFSARKF